MRNRSLNCILIAVVALTSVAASSAQELTQAEKEHALQYLESTKKDVLDATKGLSEAQWNFKPGPDRWSVAQVMEHIAAAEDFIRVDFVQKKVLTLPAGDPGRDVKMCIRDSGKPIRFKITLAGAAPGADCGTDSAPDGTGEVREPRLYQLIRQKGSVKDQTFEIEFLDPGVQAFDVTFG